jgi:hypothetical protein
VEMDTSPDALWEIPLETTTDPESADDAAVEISTVLDPTTDTTPPFVSLSPAAAML